MQKTPCHIPGTCVYLYHTKRPRYTATTPRHAASGGETQSRKQYLDIRIYVSTADGRTTAAKALDRDAAA